MSKLENNPHFWIWAGVTFVLLMAVLYALLHRKFTAWHEKSLGNELAELRADKVIREKYIKSLEQAAREDEMEIERLKNKIMRATEWRRA